MEAVVVLRALKGLERDEGFWGTVYVVCLIGAYLFAFAGISGFFDRVDGELVVQAFEWKAWAIASVVGLPVSAVVGVIAARHYGDGNTQFGAISILAIPVCLFALSLYHVLQVDG